MKKRGMRVSISRGFGIHGNEANVFKRRTRASRAALYLSYASVIWYSVVRPKRLLIVCCEQSPPHSGKVSNATPYLWLKSSRGQEHGGTKPVEALTPGARGPGSEAVYGKGSIA